MNVRNPEGWWINTEYFREEARAFEKNGYYTSAPWGSPDWIAYWNEQLERTRTGYSVGGVRITGDHYFYLNFSQMRVTKTGKNGRRKKIDSFPDFWDMDYNFFHLIEIARHGISEEELYKLHLDYMPMWIDGGHHMIVGKKRRAGYSYKNAAILANRYNNSRGYKSLVAAFDKKYSVDGTMQMVRNNLNFLNKNTGWAKKRDQIDRKDHVKASYKVEVNGIPAYKGYQSEVFSYTFKDNPDAARGKDFDYVIMEEIGKWPGAQHALAALKPCVEDGDYVTGFMCLYGCVCAGTKVWDSQGRLINIEDLQQEDGILGTDFKEVTKEEITWMKPPAKKHCYRITTSTGWVLECSEDHPILWSKPTFRYANRGFKDGKRVVNWSAKKTDWKPASEIKKGDQIAIIQSLPSFGDFEMWEPRLVGMLIGDGSYGPDKTPVLSNCDKELVNYVESRYDCVTEKEYETKDGRLYKEIRIRGIRQNLRELGIVNQTKCAKTLPVDLYKYSKESLAELIGGLFDTDGYVGQDSIVLTSACEELLREVKFLLLRFGVHGSLNEVPPLNRDRIIEDKSIYYRLTIADGESLSRFKDQISLLVGKKKIALENLIIRSSAQAPRVVRVDYDQSSKTTTLEEVTSAKFEQVKSIEYIGMKDVYNLTAGNTNTYLANGFITHNTGGSSEEGARDFSEMFYDPEPYNLMPFENIWDEDAAFGDKCGFFVSTLVSRIGHIDSSGNSLVDSAREAELSKRASILAGKSGAQVLRKHVQEYPIEPSESFTSAAGNDFPVKELTQQLGQVKSSKLDQKYGTTCTLVRESDGVKLKPDLSGKLMPVDRFPLKKDDIGLIGMEGAVVVWEFPIPDAPRGLYKIGYDPYRQDQSEDPSLGAIYVYKSANEFSYTADMLVAEYVGRPEEMDDCHRIAEMLAEAYNTEIMHENEVKDVKSYFSRVRKLHLLARQPDDVISAAVKKSKVNRIYGCHMTPAIKDSVEKYIKQWLLQERDTDEEGNTLLNLHTIYSPALLQELIKYDRKKGNFDRIMALGMCLIQLRQDEENKTHERKDKKISAIHQLKERLNNKREWNEF